MFPVGVPAWRTVVVLVLAVAVLSAPVTGQAAQPAWGGAMFADFEGMVGEYNAAIGETDLGFAGDTLANERVNLVVSDTDGSVATFSFRLDGDLRMSEFAQGEREDATLRMSADRATVEGIVAAENPARAFTGAVADGDVALDGLGLGNAVKFAVINGVAGLARTLGLF